MMDFKEILYQLDIPAQCRKYKVSLWQCPQFLFLMMGIVIVITIIAAYLIGSRYIQEPEIILLIVLILSVVLLILTYIITISFEKLAEASQMKSEFVSIASHQLKTPLTGIRWLVEKLARGKTRLTEKQKGYIQDIYQSTKRMIRLVSDLLNVSRLEIGTLMVRPKAIQFEDLIQDVIKECESLAVKKHGKIIFIKPKIKLPLILLDESLIRQVVRNLISNAVHYSEPGKCRVEIVLRKRTKDYFLTVSDKGIGITKKSQRYLFKKFFRGHAAQKMKPDGSGLGLYISKMILEFSGGRIWFESEKNKGTTFYISIPLTGMKQRKGEKMIIGKERA